MESLGFTGHFIDFVEGQALFAEGKWAAAVQKFDAAQPLLVGQPIAGKKVDLFIGQCRGTWGNGNLPRRRTTAPTTLTPINPICEPARNKCGVGLDDSDRVVGNHSNRSSPRSKRSPRRNATGRVST